MIIENNKIRYLRGQNADKGGIGGKVFPRMGSQKPQKRHIYLHTFTFHALGYSGIDKYNTLVISNL
jgi:hypothetical protein